MYCGEDNVQRALIEMASPGDPAGGEGEGLRFSGVFYHNVPEKYEFGTNQIRRHDFGIAVPPFDPADDQDAIFKEMAVTEIDQRDMQTLCDQMTGCNVLVEHKTHERVGTIRGAQLVTRANGQRDAVVDFELFPGESSDKITSGWRESRGMTTRPLIGLSLAHDRAKMTPLEVSLVNIPRRLRCVVTASASDEKAPPFIAMPMVVVADERKSPAPRMNKELSAPVVQQAAPTPFLPPPKMDGQQQQPQQAPQQPPQQQSPFSLPQGLFGQPAPQGQQQSVASADPNTQKDLAAGLAAITKQMQEGLEKKLMESLDAIAARLGQQQQQSNGSASSSSTSPSSASSQAQSSTDSQEAKSGNRKRPLDNGGAHPRDQQGRFATDMSDEGDGPAPSSSSSSSSPEKRVAPAIRVTGYPDIDEKLRSAEKQRGGLGDDVVQIAVDSLMKQASDNNVIRDEAIKAWTVMLSDGADQKTANDSLDAVLAELKDCTTAQLIQKHKIAKLALENHIRLASQVKSSDGQQQQPPQQQQQQQQRGAAPVQYNNPLPNRNVGTGVGATPGQAAQSNAADGLGWLNAGMANQIRSDVMRPIVMRTGGDLSRLGEKSVAEEVVRASDSDAPQMTAESARRTAELLEMIVTRGKQTPPGYHFFRRSWAVGANQDIWDTNGRPTSTSAVFQ